MTDSSPDGKLITQNLPAFETESVTEDEKKENDEKMMIAWRYQGQVILASDWSILLMLASDWSLLIT